MTLFVPITVTGKMIVEKVYVSTDIVHNIICNKLINRKTCKMGPKRVDAAT